MKNKYTFLDNKPSGKDLFEGKSQERTASVLVDIINDEKFQVIGIDGGWGVGKSNLVKIVDEKLKDHEFFIYDVWGHQEDDQRRSLLIELTEFLIRKNKKIFESNKWKKKLVRLLSKRKEVSTENLPYLGAGFIWSLFMIIYTPTVISFRDELSDWLNIDKIFWKAILVLFPLVIVIFLYIYYLIKNWLKKLGFLESFKISFQETFQIYTNKQKKETKIESISEEEPSVRDFQNWMTEIDNDLDKQKIVLVLDNFDRLPKGYILSIWSSIHVFFAEKKYSNIKVIIPFDRKHIKNAFSSLNGKSEDENFANDYINKTFDIVFRVSAPILSSWKMFFREQWTKAIFEYDQDEYERIEQAYEILRPNITPREIVVFINDFITQKLLNESIPGRYIAIYILSEQIILEDPLKAIIELNYLHGLEPMYKDDEEFEKNITALAYQIKPEIALEVIYKKQLFNSLVNGEVNDFIKISKINIFPSIILSIVPLLSDFRKPIIVLDQIKSIDQISSSKKKAIWQTVFSKLKDLEIQEMEIEEYQLLLLKNLQEPNRKKYLNSLIKLISKESDDFDLGLYIKNIDKLEIFCLAEKLDINPFDYINDLQLNPEELKFVVDIKKKEYVKYKFTYELIEMDEYLTKVSVDDLMKNLFVQDLNEVKSFEGFKTNLYDLLENNKTNIIDVLSILKFLKLCSEERLDILNILTDADIYTLANQFSTEDEMPADLAALRLSLLSGSSSSYNPAFVKLLDNQSEDFHIQVANELEWYIDFDEILVGSISFQNPLIKGVIKQILNISLDYRRLNFEPIINNLIQISEANDIECDTILLALDGFILDDLDIINFIKLSPEVLHELNTSESEIANFILKEIVNYFEAYVKEDWEEPFADSKFEVFMRLKAIDYIDWNTFALEEFSNFLLQIADTSAIENIEITSWLINSFIESGKNLSSLCVSLRDRLIEKNSISITLFETLIDSLIKYGKLDKRADDVVRTIFNVGLLDSDSCLKIMLDQSEFLKDLLSKAIENRSEFEESIKARLPKVLIIKLGKELDINFKEDSK
jgi:hypothetical protein